MRMLGKTCGYKRHEVKRYWRKLHSEEFQEFYTLQYITAMIRTWRMRYMTCDMHGGRREMYLYFNKILIDNLDKISF